MAIVRRLYSVRNASMWIIVGSALVMLAGASLL